MEDLLQIQKLTEWPNEPKLSDLKQNIDDTTANTSSHITKVAKWLDNLNMTGSAAIKKVKGRSSVAPKIIRRQAEWRYSSLAEPFLSTPDLFNVYPVTAGDRKRAKQNELVLNNQFNTKINKVKFIDEYVRNATDIGTVIVKVGWITEEEEVTREEPIYTFTPEPTGQLAQEYMQMLQLQQTDPERYADYSTPGLDQALQMFQETGIAYLVEKTGETETITEIKETKNHPTVNIIDSRNLIIDPSCNGDIEKAQFVSEYYKSTLSTLRKDGKRYKNLNKLNLESANPIASPDYEPETDNDNFNFEDEPRKQFIVTEYWGLWDIDGSGIAVPIVAAWVGEIMIRLEKNPFPDKKHPYVTADYMPVRRSVYGEPDGELLEDNQKVIGAVTRGMIDLMGKSANSQTGIRKDMLDVTNSRKWKNGEDYEFNSTVDPRQGIFTHSYPEIPQSAYNMITLQNADAESLSGVKAFSTGITGNSLGSVATGVRSATDAASKRESGILRRLAAGIIQIGRKFISMNAEWLSEEEVIRITAENFVTVRRDDLAGNFDLRLTISTAEEDNAKAEELAFMLQTTAQNMDAELRNMILSDIARLRKMPDLAKRIEEFKPTPDPMQQMEMELKIELLKAQIAKEVALAAKHNAEAEASGARGYKDGTQGQLNLSKASESSGKARDYNSTADKKDLDFVEQESGINHAREIEKIDRKADNDIKGKIIDYKLAPKPTKA